MTAALVAEVTAICASVLFSATAWLLQSNKPLMCRATLRLALSIAQFSCFLIAILIALIYKFANFLRTKNVTVLSNLALHDIISAPDVFIARCRFTKKKKKNLPADTEQQIVSRALNLD